MEIGSKRRVTVVAHELRGFVPVGGMGTATSFLALALARMGHSVEILLGLDTPESMDPYWSDIYERRGITTRRAPHSIEPVEPWHFLHTHSIQLGLLAEPPDVVVAHDFGAPAYSALRLRQAGLAFEDTAFVVFCHGPRRYIMDLAPSPHIPDLRNLLAVAVQEQVAIELADAVVSPSAYLLDWMRSAGWRLPEQRLVIPYFTQSSATGEPVAETAGRNAGDALRRIAFFGRLDERKGVTVFSAALNACEPQHLRAIEIVFLGKTTSSWPRARIESLLSEQTKRAVRNVVFETTLDQPAALSRLSEPGTLAVMPSLQENSPNAVYECLELGVPFIASGVGGVPELIAPDDRGRVLFEPTAEGLRNALQGILSRQRTPDPARAAFAPSASYDRWTEVAQLQPRRARCDVSTADAVDVIVVRRDSSRDVPPTCLPALERQTYANVRVVVADGPSVGAARQKGLRDGSAPYVVFLDADDAPDDDLVARLVRARSATGADVVTCGLRLDDGREGHTLHFFSGEPTGLSVLSNDCGTVGLFRRALLSDDAEPSRAEDDPDWALLARLAANGAHFVSIPVPLVTRAARPGSVERTPSEALLVVEQIEQSLASPLRSLGRLAAGAAANTAQPGAERPSALPRRALSRFLRYGR